ncbi:hypothetical protein GLN99_21940 [Shigella flexneri]|nr:hypothetical protein [Shigella flexneri]
MPARKVCQTFFRNALASTHQYRQNAIIDSAAALVGGASLSLTSIGRHLPGPARVKDKIKRVDCLLGNKRLRCTGNSGHYHLFFFKQPSDDIFP